MRTRLVAVVLAAATLLVVPTASAKEFGPGDLRLCNATTCVPVRDASVLDVLSGFYYSGPKPRVAPRPRLGAPVFELRFRNGYVTGIGATSRLDRFLSYGVHLGWFRTSTWYRVPESAARELQRLAASLEPLRLTRGSLSRSR